MPNNVVYTSHSAKCESWQSAKNVRKEQMSRFCACPVDTEKSVNSAIMAPGNFARPKPPPSLLRAIPFSMHWHSLSGFVVNGRASQQQESIFNWSRNSFSLNNQGSMAFF